MKRTLSIVLSLIMTVSALTALPFTASALGASGSCGENVTYTYDSSTGALVISGTGAMTDYSSYNSSPFYYVQGMKSVEIKSGVTSIGKNAFSSCLATSITVPDTVTSIGQYAFYRWKNLEEFIIPNAVVTIPIGAFYECEKLQNVTIPDSVRYIESSAFQGCKAFTAVTIPKTVTSIGRAAFADCPDVETITVESGNTVYDSRENCNAIIETSTDKLIAGCKNTVIPDGVKGIAATAFYACSKLTDIVIPESVTLLGTEAFEKCINLKSITINSNIKEIDNYAFGYCSSLESVIISDGVETIRPYAFVKCTALTGVVIPESVTTIGDSAFSNCTSLSSIRYLGDATDFSGINLGTGNDILVAENITFEKSQNEKGHTVLHNPAVAADATKDGTVEYWYCKDCDKNYADDKCEKELTSLVAHYMTPTAARPATCTEGGNNAYFYCENCKKYYKEEAGLTETTPEAEVTAMLGHDFSDNAEYCKNNCGTKNPDYVPPAEPEEESGKQPEAEPTAEPEVPAAAVKKDNPLTVKAKKLKKFSFKKLRNKKLVIKRKKAISVKGAKGKVTFAKVKNKKNKKILVNKKTGKITLKKGIKKGTYKVKIKVTAAGNNEYNPITRTVKIKIVVK